LCHSLVRSDLYSTIRTYQNAISLQKECWTGFSEALKKKGFRGNGLA
jgi:hypothetical protein